MPGITNNFRQEFPDGIWNHILSGFMKIQQPLMFKSHIQLLLPKQVKQLLIKSKYQFIFSKTNVIVSYISKSIFSYKSSSTLKTLHYSYHGRVSYLSKRFTCLQSINFLTKLRDVCCLQVLTSNQKCSRIHV